MTGPQDGRTGPATLQKSRKPAQLSRAQIFDITYRCLIEEGYEGTTIRRLASMLGCAVGSIYRHYRDKQRLLKDVTQSMFKPVADMIAAGEPFEGSVAHYLELVNAQRECYRLMFWLESAFLESKPARRPQLRPAPEAETVAVKPTGMPTVIRRIIEGWGNQLGNVSLARECWAYLHGAITLGDRRETILRTVLKLATVEAHLPARPTPAPPQPAAVQPEIVTVTTTPPHPDVIGRRSIMNRAEDLVAASIPAVRDDDVCLL